MTERKVLRPVATHWGNYEVEVFDGRVVGMHPHAHDPDPSAIAQNVPEALTHPCRIRQPMVRQGWLERGPRRGGNRRGSEPFIALDWDEALDLAARELDRVKDQHGNRAIYGGSYGWGSAGVFHNAPSQLHRFLSCHGGYVFRINTYSMGALEVILPHVIGSSWAYAGVMPTWPEVAEYGELVVSFGGLAPKNSQMNFGGVGRHQNRGWYDDCQRAGVTFVNVSPIRADAAAELEAEWLPIRPNTDVALMLGLAHTLVSENLHDVDFLERCCVGFERFRRYLSGEADGTRKDADWAAGITEVDAATIRALARRIAASRTLITVSWSVQRGDHGEQPYWLAVTLAAMSGSMGKPGGGFGSGYGATHSWGAPQRKARVAALPQGENAVRDFIPVARIADMLLRPGETIDYNGQRLELPDIRLVYWCGGNPFHHHQDLNRLVRAWQEPDTVIVHDSWWTPVTRFADLVFPVATAVERSDFAAGQGDPWLSATRQAVPPPAGVLADYGVFAALAERLGFEESFTEGRNDDEWVEYLYAETRELVSATGIELPAYDEFQRRGGVELPVPATKPVAFGALRDDPDENPLLTPSGRIEICSETIEGFGYEDCPGHPAWLEPIEWLGSPLAARFPLHLISNQPASRLHSQFDLGATSQASKVAGREPVLMHPDDAAARDIADGDVVRLFNDRGACLAGAVLSDSIRAGVVMIATGAWYDPAEPGVAGSLCRSGNPNVLTIDKGTSRLAQATIAQTTLVEAELCPGEPPPTHAYEPPEIVYAETTQPSTAQRPETPC